MGKVNIYEGEMGDDDLIEYVQRVRRQQLINAATPEGDIENNEGNSILLRDLANTAIATKRLRQNDRAIDNQSRNADLAQEIIDTIGSGGGNPLTRGATEIRYIEADIDSVGEAINPDTTVLGRQQLTLEEAGIDINDC